MKGGPEYLEKADTALSDLTSGGGLLVPEQAARFIQLLVQEAVLLKEVNVPTMANPKQRIETIRFGSRVLKPGGEAVALAAGDRSKPDFTQVELDVFKIQAEVRYSYEVVEDNIARGGFRTQLLQSLAEAVSRDLDELIAQGDTASADTYLALVDGIVKAATSNVNAKAPTSSIVHNDFVDTLQVMPVEFQRDKAMMRFFTSVNAEHDYRASLAQRATARGDSELESGAPLKPLGIKLMPVPMFPTNLGTGTDETVILLTHPKNINAGFHRKILMETDKDISAQQWIVVVSMRMDLKYTHEPAVTKTTGVFG